MIGDAISIPLFRLGLHSAKAGRPRWHVAQGCKHARQLDDREFTTEQDIEVAWAEIASGMTKTDAMQIAMREYYAPAEPEPNLWRLSTLDVPASAEADATNRGEAGSTPREEQPAPGGVNPSPGNLF